MAITPVGSEELFGSLDLSESPASVDTASFSKALDRYQSQARSIQKTFQALYGQLERSASSPPRNTPSPVSQQMITNVQQRLEQLEADRRELEQQMLQFANLSDFSSVSQPSFSTPKAHASRLSLSGTSDAGSSIDTPIKKLKVENTRLRSRLVAESNANRQLKAGLASVLDFVSHQCATITSRLASVVARKLTQIDRISDSIALMRLQNQSKKHKLRGISAQLVSQRASVVTILEDFRCEIARARVAAVARIRSQRQRSSPGSVDSVSRSPVDPTRNTSHPGKHLHAVPQSPDKVTETLAAGCDELGRCIARYFEKGQTVEPALAIAHDPSGFGKQIARLCAAQDVEVAEMRSEIEEFRLKLQEAQDALKSRAISPEVMEVASRILVSIGSLSDQMKREHEVLVAKLT
jgi:hypothetical protein